MANTTKLALEASLKELLRTKPIDKGMHEDYHKIVMTMGTALAGNIARSIENFKQKYKLIKMTEMIKILSFQAFCKWYLCTEMVR